MTVCGSTVSSCVMDGKPLPSRKRMYCSARCMNRAMQIARYGLSITDFKELTKTGRCAICNRVTRKWHIDHDHKTLEVMGAVCSVCNVHVLSGLRRADDPIEAAERLVKYLRNPPGRRIDGEPRYIRKSMQDRLDKRKEKLGTPRRRFFR